MTLFEIVPSLRRAATPRIDRAIWPLTTHVDELAPYGVASGPTDGRSSQYGLLVTDGASLS
jgi:diaminopimelate decarboxylase